MKNFLVCHGSKLNFWYAKFKEIDNPVSIITELNVINYDTISNTPEHNFVFFDVSDFEPEIVEKSISKLAKYYLTVFDPASTFASFIIRNSSEFSVNDYLQKVDNVETLNLVIQRFQESIKNDPTDMVVGEYFIVKDRGENTFVNLNNITVLEGLGAYTKVHSINKQYIVSKNLKKLLEQLPSCFIRTHRSFAVHIKHINSLIGNQVLLHNGKTVRASKTGKKSLISRFTMA